MNVWYGAHHDLANIATSVSGFILRITKGKLNYTGIHHRKSTIPGSYYSNTIPIQIKLHRPITHPTPVCTTTITLRDCHYLLHYCL